MFGWGGGDDETQEASEDKQLEMDRTEEAVLEDERPQDESVVTDVPENGNLEVAEEEEKSCDVDTDALDSLLETDDVEPRDAAADTLNEENHATEELDAYEILQDDVPTDELQGNDTTAAVEVSENNLVEAPENETTHTIAEAEDGHRPDTGLLDDLLDDDNEGKTTEVVANQEADLLGELIADDNLEVGDTDSKHGQFDAKDSEMENIVAEVETGAGVQPEVTEASMSEAVSDDVLKSREENLCAQDINAEAGEVDENALADADATLLRASNIQDAADETTEVAEEPEEVKEQQGIYLQECPECNGTGSISGWISTSECSYCQGTGKVKVDEQNGERRCSNVSTTWTQPPSGSPSSPTMTSPDTVPTSPDTDVAPSSPASSAHRKASRPKSCQFARSDDQRKAQLQEIAELLQTQNDVITRIRVDHEAQMQMLRTRHQALCKCLSNAGLKAAFHARPDKILRTSSSSSQGRNLKTAPGERSNGSTDETRHSVSAPSALPFGAQDSQVSGISSDGQRTSIAAPGEPPLRTQRSGSFSKEPKASMAAPGAPPLRTLRSRSFSEAQRASLLAPGELPLSRQRSNSFTEGQQISMNTPGVVDKDGRPSVSGLPNEPISEPGDIGTRASRRISQLETVSEESPAVVEETPTGQDEWSMFGGVF